MQTAPPHAPVVWQDGVLRSTLYGDIYFSQEDGLAESRAVFLDGCDLPEGWRDRTRFTVAELGFGTGLNIAALLDLWSKTRPAGGHLHIFSIEAHPMAREDAARALLAWPQIGSAAQALLARWPSVRRGFQRIDLPGWNATFDLAVMEVGEALQQWQGRADAWFLDGFSPASNPDMWRGEVLALIAARSAPGARAATFTIAGAVRRGLEAEGFEIARRPGFGRKKERLEARFSGPAPRHSADPRVVVIGGGIAGASLARAFAELGLPARVVTPPERSASGNPAALVMPGLDASGNARARLYAASLLRATQLYDQVPGGVIAHGALLVEYEERDPRRHAAIARQDAFEPGAVEKASPGRAAVWLNEPQASAGLIFHDGRVIEPAAVINAWLGEAVIPGCATGLARSGDAWVITLASGEVLEADFVVVAAGWDASALIPGLPLQAIRGQATWMDLDDPPAPASFGGYAIPTRTGVLFGATHDRDDVSTDIRPEDDARNLSSIAGVRSTLAARIDLAATQARAAIRAATPDQLPLAGELSPGLFILGGLGSRGFATAPLLAEHLAALICGAPSPLAAEAAALVDPKRL